MSKKHFISLADAVRPLELSEEVLNTLANWCLEQNHHFNRERWIGYIKGECGPSLD